MKRFMYYPFFKYDVLDKKLANMEASGYRLDHVSPFWFFHFKPCKPRQVKYITTYTYAKELDHCGHNLLSRYKANIILPADPINILGTVSFFRITKNDADLSEIISERNHYLRHALWMKLLMNLLFWVISLVGLILNDPVDGNFYNVIFSIINVLSFICLLWNIVNLVTLHHKNKYFANK